VNEIAPRVHNSGHYTLDAAKTSQFEQHLRAALGLPLGSVDTAGYFRMKNWLGSPDVSFDRPNARPVAALDDRVRIYDYGKVGVQPGRKLGHLTIFGEPRERAECRQKLDAALEKWTNSVRP
jgi:5-(carboxyamino)imidazole ribonucleotide synthase